MICQNTKTSYSYKNRLSLMNLFIFYFLLAEMHVNLIRNCGKVCWKCSIGIGNQRDEMLSDQAYQMSTAWPHLSKHKKYYEYSMNAKALHAILSVAMFCFLFYLRLFVSLFCIYVVTQPTAVCYWTSEWSNFYHFICSRIKHKFSIFGMSLTVTDRYY